MATTTTTTEGEWEYAHVAGACDIAYASGETRGTERLVTCGADHLVTVRDPKSEDGSAQKTFDEHTDAVNALATSPCGGRVATASSDYAVKVFSLEKGAFEANVTRFTLPVHAIAWSADGRYIAAGGEDTAVKVINVEDKSVKLELECPRSKCIKSLAFDPRGDFLAGTDDNGMIFVWVLKARSEDEEAGDVAFTGTVAPMATAESTLLNTVAWRPDGAVLAVPGRENDVSFFERDSFKEIEWELKGHSDTISLIRWSPNGKYLLTASADKTVIIWDVKKKLAISKMTDTSELVCGASFSKLNNEVALINNDGSWALWKDVVAPPLAPPTMEVSAAEIDFQGYAEEKKSDLLDQDDDDEDEAMEEDDFIDDEEDKPKRAAAPQQVVQVATGPKPQPAFQSGSVASAPGSNRRFLSYTMVGSLVSTQEAGFNSVEFQFHDSSRMGRIPTITDYEGYTMGVAGEMGCALASPLKDAENESTLYFRAYDSWTSDCEWQMKMPAGESILSIATGSSFVAAVTSKRYLRVYSLGGAQRQIISLEGDGVCVSARDDTLAVIWHEAAPIGPAPGDQVLAYAVYNMRYTTQVARGRVALSHGATLTYLGFSEEGMLVTGDSMGVVRMRTDAFGGSWTPVFRSSSTRATDGQHHWLVSTSATTVYCIITRTSAGPTPNPRPVLSMLPVSVPVVIPENSSGDLEDEAAKANLALAIAQTCGDDTRLALAATEKAAIKLFHTACKAEQLGRASDIAETFRQPKSLQAVLKLPAVAKQPSLVARIRELAETAVDPEPTQGYTQPESYTPAPALKSTPAAKANPFARKSTPSQAKAGDENKDLNEQSTIEGKRENEATPTPSKSKKSKVSANPFAR
jgi:chromosome transmission fidelity protein 4